MIRKESASLFLSGKIRTFLKKHSWLFLLLLIAGAVFLYSRIPAAYAESTQERWQLRKKMETFLEAFKRTNFHYMVQAYERFRDLTADDSRFPFAVTVKRISLGLGYAMVVIFSLTGVIKESQKGEISMDYWFRIFTVTVAAVIVMSSVNPIMDSIYDVGNYIVVSVEAAVEDTGAGIWAVAESEEEQKKIIHALSEIPGLSGDENGSNSLEQLLDEEYEGNFFALQEACEMLQYLNLLVILPVLLSMYLITAAVFEVKIRQVFAPIAIASIASDGARSSGMRFLKKYLACFVKIAIYFFIAAVGAELTGFFYHALISLPDDTESTDPVYVINLALMLLSNIIAAMAMLQSSGMGDEIVGV